MTMMSVILTYANSTASKLELYMNLPYPPPVPLCFALFRYFIPRSILLASHFGHFVLCGILFTQKTLFASFLLTVYCLYVYVYISLCVSAYSNIVIA